MDLRPAIVRDGRDEQQQTAVAPVSTLDGWIWALLIVIARLLKATRLIRRNLLLLNQVLPHSLETGSSLSDLPHLNQRTLGKQ
jgi:hypothetical protein